jgi:hypothetical protein
MRSQSVSREILKRLTAYDAPPSQQLQLIG